LSLPFAIALMIVGGGCLSLGMQIEQSAMSGEHDPGPKMLPVGLSGVLLLGGLTGATLRLTDRQQLASAATVEGGSDSARFGNAPAAFVALLLYAIAIPWLGFQVSTLAFVTGLLTWLGARWWSSLLMAILVISVVRFVFGNLFYVQLPEGAFGLSL